MTKEEKEAADKNCSLGIHIKGDINHIYTSSSKYGAEFKCSNCGELFDDTVTPQDINMPIISFYGNIDNVTKEELTEISGKYDDGTDSFEFDATLKLQGSTALNFDKKNYTIRLYKKDTEFTKKLKVELKDGWGSESKYCIKANWVDFSQSRNIVSGQIFSDVVKTSSKQTDVALLANGGAVDGFPVAMYVSGKFKGLYTINIPKDKWMFGMDDIDEGRQAILMADDNTSSVCFGEEATYENGFKLEYCSTEDTTWVLRSFNKMINYVQMHDADTYDKYIDVDRCIDVMIMNWVTDSYDNRGKNILWITYDGVKWMPSIYDYDDSWGMKYDGEEFSYSTEAPISDFLINIAFKKIYNTYYDKIVARYKELRKGPLSYENIEARFTAFNESINPTVKDAEKRKWNFVPSQDVNNIDQILTFASKRLSYLDGQLV